MLCDQVIARLSNPPDDLPRGKRSIVLELTWLQCHGRTFRQALDDGRTIRLIMPPGVILRHGDVVHEDEGEIVWIHQRPCPVLMVRSDGGPSLPHLMYELGNLHAPLELLADGFVTLPDGPIEAALNKHGVTFHPETRRFNPIPLPNGESFQLANHFTVIRKTS